MSTKLFAFTSLLALAAARPTITTRDNTNCWETDPGSVFYSCSNGYKGCFYQDPCALPPLSNTPSTPSPSTSATTYELTVPRSYNIYPLSEAQHNVQDKVGHVDLNKPAGSAITTTNALVFDNVPSGAKNCRLNWRSTVPNDDNNFTLAGSGRAFTRQLTGFPSTSEIVSYDGLKPYQDGGDWIETLDFSGGPGKPGSHEGPIVKCGEQVALEVKGDGEGDGENRIFFTLTKTNGFYLSYEL